MNIQTNIIKLSILFTLITISHACLNDTYCIDCSPVPIGFDIFGNLYVIMTCFQCTTQRQLNLDNECQCKSQYYIDSNMQCASCPQNSYINSQRQCICNQGFYKNSSNKCIKCQSTCQTCSEKQCLGCSLSSNRQLVNGQCICIEGYQQRQGQVSCVQKPNILMIVISTVGSIICFIGSAIVCACLRMRRRGQQVTDQHRKNNSQNIQMEIYESYESSGPMQNCSNLFWNSKSFEYSANQQCSICLQSKTYFMTECGHYFHAKCIYDWIQKRNNCPNCNRQISAKDIRRWCQKCQKVLMPVIRNIVIKRIGKNGRKKKQLVQSTPVEYQCCQQCDALNSNSQVLSSSKNNQSQSIS